MRGEGAEQEKANNNNRDFGNDETTTRNAAFHLQADLVNALNEMENKNPALQAGVMSQSLLVFCCAITIMMMM